jgi:hypothetical protein
MMIPRSSFIALCALAPVALLVLVAPAVRIPLHASLVLSFACTVAAVALSAHAAQIHALGERVGRSVIAMVTGIVTAMLSFYFARGAIAGSLRDVLTGLGSTAAILITANAIGSLVGWRVPKAGHLLPVALVSSAVDLWSVFAPEGPTHAIATAPDPALLRLLAASAPIAPSRAMEPMLGFADVIFAALYLTAARRHQLSLARMTTAIVVGLLVAGLLAMLLGRALPALPFVGLSVVLFVREGRSVPREDRPALWVAVALLLAAFSRLVWNTLSR